MLSAEAIKSGFVTLGEASVDSRKSRRSLERAIERGDLVARKVGHSVRIPLGEWERYKSGAEAWKGTELALVVQVDELRKRVEALEAGRAPA